MRGPLNPNWNGGAVRHERHTAMGRVEYINWRRAVYERDDFTCQDCEARGGRLHAHHLQPWAEFPALRYEIDNGVTLCVDCHRIRHERREALTLWL
jgi:5-methylcytosine-specific restriction endonuclease McrA